MTIDRLKKEENSKKKFKGILPLLRLGLQKILWDYDILKNKRRAKELDKSHFNEIINYIEGNLKLFTLIDEWDNYQKYRIDESEIRIRNNNNITPYWISEIKRLSEKNPKWIQISNEIISLMDDIVGARFWTLKRDESTNTYIYTRELRVKPNNSFLDYSYMPEINEGMLLNSTTHQP